MYCIVIEKQDPNGVIAQVDMHGPYSSEEKAEGELTADGWLFEELIGAYMKPSGHVCDASIYIAKVRELLTLKKSAEQGRS